jgi:hypothetical protein
VLAQLAQLAQAQAQVDQAQLSLVPGPWSAHLGPCCSAATRQARTQAWRGFRPCCSARIPGPDAWLARRLLGPRPPVFGPPPGLRRL